jgi:hypothetical protein
MAADVRPATKDTPLPGRGWAVALVLVSLLSLAMLFDARRRRENVDRSEVAAWIHATGDADLFLSSGSRWLRHPHTTEPNAASADAPDGLDVDPAGMAVAGYDGASGGHWLIVLPRAR